MQNTAATLENKLLSFMMLNMYLPHDSENTTGYLPSKKNKKKIYTKSYMEMFISDFYISTQNNPNDKKLQTLIRLTG